MSGGSDSLNKNFYDLLLYWVVALLSSLLGKPLRIPPLLLYLILGAVIGNLHWVDHTSEATTFFAEWSITIVFFSLGFEENAEHFMDSIRASWGIALIGAVIPFGCGYLCGIIFWFEAGWPLHITLATAVTATAVSLTMMLLQSEGLLKTRAAVGIMSSAVLDDVGCLILVSILLPVVVAASPSAAVADILTPYDNVTVAFTVDADFSAISTQAHIDAAKHLIASDISHLTNMSTVELDLSATFTTSSADISFTNSAPVSCKAFDDQYFIDHLATDDTWLKLLGDTYSPFSNYVVSTKEHKVVNVRSPGEPEHKESIDAVSIVWIIGKVAIFMVIIWFLHNVFLPDTITEGWVSYIPLVRTYGMRHLLAFADGEQVPLIIVTFGLALGMLGVSFGFHPAIGAYFAGLILEESYFSLPPACPCSGEKDDGENKKQEDEDETAEKDAIPQSMKPSRNNSAYQQRSVANSSKPNNKDTTTSGKDTSNKNKDENNNNNNNESSLPTKTPKRDPSAQRSRAGGNASSIVGEGANNNNNAATNKKDLLNEQKGKDAMMDSFLNHEATNNEIQIDDGEFDRVMAEKKKQQGDNDTAYESLYPETPFEGDEEELAAMLEAEAAAVATRNTMERARDAVATAAFMWCGPVFFVHLGAGFEVRADLLATAIPQALAMTAILYVGQFLSATFAARYIPGNCGITWAESCLIGFGMLGRAELYFVVLNEAKNSKVIDNEIFFPMALTALFMNISLAFSITLFRDTFIKYETWEPEPSEEEKKKKEIEEQEEKDKDSKKPSHAPTERSRDSRMSRLSRISRISTIVRRGVGMRGVVEERDLDTGHALMSNLPTESRDVLKARHAANAFGMIGGVGGMAFNSVVGVEDNGDNDNESNNGGEEMNNMEDANTGKNKSQNNSRYPSRGPYRSTSRPRAGGNNNNEEDDDNNKHSSAVRGNRPASVIGGAGGLKMLRRQAKGANNNNANANDNSPENVRASNNQPDNSNNNNNANDNFDRRSSAPRVQRNPNEQLARLRHASRAPSAIGIKFYKPSNYAQQKQQEKNEPTTEE